MTKTTSTNPPLLSPRKALNVAFLRVKRLRLHIETFKENLIKLLEQINVAESEEFHKISCLNFWTLPIIPPTITSTRRDETT